MSVPYMGLPSWGLRNRTPSSVTCANLRSETIWNLAKSQAGMIL